MKKNQETPALNLLSILEIEIVLFVMTIFSNMAYGLVSHLSVENRMLNAFETS